MKISKENWKDCNLNTDSLWLIGPRSKGGKHSNFYHGNFVPQIPDQMIRRFTEEGDVVLDMFMGSGTALFEAEKHNRAYIGFDINPEVLNFVAEKMEGSTANYFVHDCDIMNFDGVNQTITNDLKILGKKAIDLVIIHPPYLNIVKFTDKKEDLSNINDVNLFVEKFTEAVRNIYKFLKRGGRIVLVVGDIYQNCEVIPLGFYLMYAIRKFLRCQLKGIVVKDMVGNRAKLSNEALWRFRALRGGTFLFKHEYVFVFRKI